MAHVGFIGLGKIGTQMAARILQAGHELTGHSRQSGKDGLRALGAAITPSLIETTQAVDVLCICAFDDQQIREALLESGALAATSPGCVIVIHSTASPDLMCELDKAAPEGVSVLDAAFSGTAENVQQGQLVLMAGGMDRALDTARPVLSSYAKQIFHVGEVGAGQRVKLLNNLMFACHANLAAELLRVSEGFGLDRKKVVAVLEKSSGRSFALDRLGGADDPDAMLAAIGHYMKKDVSLAISEADQLGLDLNVLKSAAHSFLRP